MKQGKFHSKKTVKTDKKTINSFVLSLKLSGIKHFYYSIDRVKNIKFNQLPDIDQCCHFQTTKNIRSSEILNIIDKKYGIEKIHMSFNHIDNLGFNDVSRYKIGMLLVKNWKDNNKDEIKILESIVAEKIIKPYSHVKNYLIITKSGGKISIVTSANPKISSRFEQYSVYNNEQFFENMIKMYEKIEIESK